MRACEFNVFERNIELIEELVKAMNSNMLSFAFLLIVLSVTLYFSSTYASTQSPNIVVIIADDLVRHYHCVICVMR